MHAADDKRLVRIAVQEGDDDLVAHARPRDQAEPGASPTLSDARAPAYGVPALVGSVPDELDEHAAQLVDVHRSVRRRTRDERRLRACDPGFAGGTRTIGRARRDADELVPDGVAVRTCGQARLGSDHEQVAIRFGSRCVEQRETCAGREQKVAATGHDIHQGTFGLEQVLASRGAALGFTERADLEGVDLELTLILGQLISCGDRPGLERDAGAGGRIPWPAS